MFLKTKENEKIKKQRTGFIALMGVAFLMLVIIIFMTNKKVVLERVGQRFSKNDTNKTGEAINNTTEIKNIDISNWDTDKVNIVYDKDNVAVPVPKGYVASSVENGITPIGQEVPEENRVSTGFVIYELTAEEIESGIEASITKDNFWEESQKRNQWVWVPVPDSSRIYERDSTTGKAKAKLWDFTTTGRITIANRDNEPGIVSKYDNEKYFAAYDMQGMTRAKLLEELENEYEATMESIEKYGGFYVGRYETGNVGSGSQSNHNTPRQPVVQRMNTNIKYVTWYDAYNNIRNIQRNENIKSNIIWGSLWDETLQWLVDSRDKTYEEIKNSFAWGNHKYSEFDYIAENGMAGHKDANIGMMVPTGSSERNKANNIYDMAGNMFEWTLEAVGIVGRSFRGGSYTDAATSWSVDGHSNNYPIRSSFYYGVRAYFYIK